MMSTQLKHALAKSTSHQLFEQLSIKEMCASVRMRKINSKGMLIVPGRVSLHPIWRALIQWAIIGINVRGILILRVNEMLNHNSILIVASRSLGLPIISQGMSLCSIMSMGDGTFEREYTWNNLAL